MVTPDIYLKTVGKSNFRELTNPWTHKGEEVHIAFTWDGSSAPRILSPIISQWRNPKASCWHDFKCRQIRIAMALAKTRLDSSEITKKDYKIIKKQQEHNRKVADQDYSDLVGNTESKAVAWAGWVGTRLGGIFLKAGW